MSNAHDRCIIEDALAIAEEAFMLFCTDWHAMGGDPVDASTAWCRADYSVQQRYRTRADKRLVERGEIPR